MAAASPDQSEPLEWRWYRTAHQMRVNERIRVKTVRLVDSEGNQLGVVPIEEALAAARDAELDLVEVAPGADPPVCRVMDYGKFKYKQKKKTHQSGPKHHVAQVKEVRLRPKTDTHDVEVKRNRAIRFLGRGDKVLVNMLFRGREMAHVDIGREILQQFAIDLEDMAKVESPPKMERNKMHMLLAPK